MSRGGCSDAVTSLRSASMGLSMRPQRRRFLPTLIPTLKTLALTRASHGWVTDVCASHFTDRQPKKCLLEFG